MMHIDRRSKNNRARIQVEMTQLQMGKGEKFQEMNRGGRIPLLGCEKKVEIGHNLEGKRTVRRVEMAIFQKLPLLWEPISSRLQTRYGKHHRRRFKRQLLNFSKKEETQ